MKTLNRWLLLLAALVVTVFAGSQVGAEGVGKPFTELQGIGVTFTSDINTPIEADVPVESLTYRLRKHPTDPDFRLNGQAFDGSARKLEAGDVVTYLNDQGQTVRITAKTRNPHDQLFVLNTADKELSFDTSHGWSYDATFDFTVSVDGETRGSYISMIDFDYSEKAYVRKDQIAHIILKSNTRMTYTEEGDYIVFHGLQGNARLRETEQEAWVGLVLKSSTFDGKIVGGIASNVGVRGAQMATAIIPATASFTARKIWDGGPATKPTVRFVLQQNGVDYTGADAVKELPNGTTEVTWTDLPKQDANKVDYVYTVREEAVPNYTTSYNADTTEVTNTYVSPKTTFTATKVWVNGPAVKPSIDLQLFQNGVAYGAPVTLSNGTISHTWTDLPENDATGTAYTYTVDEVATPANYRKSVAGSTITNTYVAPRTSYTAKKVWVGGTDTRPDIQFQLYRDGVALGIPVTLTNGTLEYTWTDLAETDEAGNVYTYTVDEVDVPVNYTKVVSGNTITNTYVSPKTTYTAKKVWVGGASTRPDIQFQLYRNGVAFGAPVTLTSGTTEYTWTDLDETDENGIAYDYTVDEVDVPVNYIKSIAGNTITNTYVSPKVSYTAKKVWVGGPSRPDIDLQLYRDGVALGAPVTLVSGETEYTWTDLDETDADGKVYAYTVDEVIVPDNYVKSIVDNTITNTYQTVEIAVRKIWEDDNKVDARPASITIVLYADGIETGQQLTLTAANGWQGAFVDLPKTKDGKEIVYTIKEVEVAGYTSKVTGDVASGFVVTNTIVPPVVTPPSSTTSSSSTTPPTSSAVVKPKAELPKTGAVESALLLWGGLMLLAVSLVWAKRRA